MRVNRTLPRRLPNAEYRQREYLTENEVDRLIDAARKRGRNSARDSAAILLAYRHGLRAQELCQLRWAQIDLPLHGPELRALFTEKSSIFSVYTCSEMVSNGVTREKNPYAHDVICFPQRRYRISASHKKKGRCDCAPLCSECWLREWSPDWRWNVRLCEVVTQPVAQLVNVILVPCVDQRGADFIDSGVLQRRFQVWRYGFHNAL